MSNLEFLINVSAVGTFFFLAYWLALILCSMPANLCRLNDVLTTLASIRQAAAGHGPTLSRRRWQDLLDKFVLPGGSQACPALMIHHVIQCWRSDDSDLAAVYFSNWMTRTSCNWHRNLALATYATDFGMLFTVTGGILAFAHIGASEEPFAAFAALALAMLTTAAGLTISICTRYLLGAIERRLQLVEYQASELVAFAVYSLQKPLGPKVKSKAKNHAEVPRVTTSSIGRRSADGQQLPKVNTFRAMEHPTSGNGYLPTEPKS